jgi:hypothetical protein
MLQAIGSATAYYRVGLIVIRFTLGPSSTDERSGNFGFRDTQSRGDQRIETLYERQELSPSFRYWFLGWTFGAGQVGAYPNVRERSDDRLTAIALSMADPALAYHKRLVVSHRAKSRDVGPKTVSLWQLER